MQKTVCQESIKLFRNKGTHPLERWGRPFSFPGKYFADRQNMWQHSFRRSARICSLEGGFYSEKKKTIQKNPAEAGKKNTKRKKNGQRISADREEERSLLSRDQILIPLRGSRESREDLIRKETYIPSRKSQ